MKIDPLPAEFVAWLKDYILSAQFTNVRRLHRGLILRWGFWQDGVSQNKLPGYATCPKPALGSEFPAGWSYRKFNAIAREAIGTEVVHAARKRAASYPRINCGSGHDYGICPVCGKGHGTVIYQDGKPSAIVTGTA